MLQAGFLLLAGPKWKRTSCKTTKDFPCSLLFAWRPPWAFVKPSDFQMRMRSGCYLSRHIRKFALICQIITHAQGQKSEIAGFSPSYVSFDLWLPGFLKLIHAACLNCARCSLVQISVLTKPQFPHSGPVFTKAQQGPYTVHKSSQIFHFSMHKKLDVI